MTFTTLRRRKADAYHTAIAPAAVATQVTAAQQAAWDAAGGRVLYQRGYGQWTYTPGGDPEADIVDPGTRQDQVAQVLLAALPLADPATGAARLTYFETPSGMPWSPGSTVHALACDPISGDVAVYWSRDDEWDFDAGTLHLDRFSTAGAYLGGQTIALTQGDVGRAPIACAWAAGALWAIEPQPSPATPEGTIDFFLPSRIVRRLGSGLGVSGSRNLEESIADGWPGGDSICPDPAGPGAWAIINRSWLAGTGPFPGSPSFYDVSYILPLSSGLAGAEDLLTFGHGLPDPWYMDEGASFGRSTILDSVSAGTPALVSIGNDPAAWPAGDYDSQIWRWTYAGGAEARVAGGGRTSAAYTGGWYGRSLWRTAAGAYLVHPGADAEVDQLTLEALG